jgi:hypothetical protein
MAERKKGNPGFTQVKELSLSGATFNMISCSANLLQRQDDSKTTTNSKQDELKRTARIDDRARAT